MMRWSLCVFFRKIYFSNEKNIPNAGPTIFALNHPTAFIDPIVVAALAKPTMYFMLRGDMFKGRIIKYLLNAINTIPIFRFRDGFSSLKNNMGTMELVFEKLNGGANIIILAEGQCTHEKKMRPIQKGAAKMAFGTFDKFGKSDVKIVPMGINFSDADSFRSDIMVDFGDPIPLSKYLDEYKENPRVAINKLTEEISDNMRSRIIHIDDSKREPVANILLEVKRSSVPSKLLPTIDPSDRVLKEEWKVAELINRTGAEEFDRIAGVAENYHTVIEGLSLTDRAIANLGYFNWKNGLILLTGLVPFLVGFLMNFIPLLIAKIFVDKKIKMVQFKSSVRLAIGFFAWLIIYLLLIIILPFLGWTWWMILAIPFLGFFALTWHDLFVNWNGARKFLSLPDSIKMEIKTLRSQLATFVDLQE